MLYLIYYKYVNNNVIIKKICKSYYTGMNRYTIQFNIYNHEI